MNLRWCKTVGMCLLVILLSAPSLLAQRYELHPYGGYIWPGTSAVGHLKDQTIYGVKFGYFFDPNIELELNGGYLNQFEVRSINPKSRGLLWEVGINGNFSSQEFFFKRQFTPYLAAGVGGITTKLGNSVTLPVVNQITLADGTNLTAVRNIGVQGRDTFFTVSYGAGIKSVRLSGPFGLRFEVRGRTLPNYYGSTPTWLEATAGFNLMWGEAQ
jgi:hypothetical protein